MKPAIAIRHLAFEDLGQFAPVLEAAGYQIEYWDIGVDELWKLDPLKTPLLIVLGGPIGVYEEAKYPFLTNKIALIEDRLSAKLPTLGICLGAQLMARALGARVYPGPAKEIGFAPITLTEAGRQSCLSHFADHPVLHWHGDTFDLPEGAVRLASTDICPNQAFAVGRHALGVQFHPETGGPGFERWLIGHTLELAMAGIDVAGLRADHERLAPSLALRAQACMSTWLAGLEG